MLQAVIATEEGGGGAAVPVRTLSWAPGPMDTAMQATLRECSTLEAGTRDFFNGLLASNTYVPLEASATKCVRILLAGKHKNGVHLDFYDPEPE